MLYFLSLSLSLILIPVAMVFFGLLWRKSPPREINELYGYRTPRSKQSQEAWDFAHAYHARVWLYSGLALLVLTAVALALLANKENYLTYFTVIMAVQIAVMLGSLAPTELALKKRFGRKRDE